MRKLVVDEFMTLDGVVQGPGYLDEDTSGGFRQGGWHMPYMDERAMRWIVDGIGSSGGFVLGRRTYDIFAAYWPNAGKDEEPVAGAPELTAQVRRLAHAQRAADMAELKIARRRRRERGGCPQEGRGPGAARHR